MSHLNKNKWEKMTVDEAIEYCYENQYQFANSIENYEEDMFLSIICLLESGSIKPKDLPSYGMDY